jgi:hypothetical protein
MWIMPGLAQPLLGILARDEAQVFARGCQAGEAAELRGKAQQSFGPGVEDIRQDLRRERAGWRRLSNWVRGLTGFFKIDDG